MSSRRKFITASRTSQRRSKARPALLALGRARNSSASGRCSVTCRIATRLSQRGLEAVLSSTFFRIRAISAPGSTWKNRSEEHTSELQSLMRISYAVFCLKKKNKNNNITKKPLVNKNKPDQQITYMSYYKRQGRQHD